MKTRLSIDIGPAAAAALYRRVGRSVVAATGVGATDYRTIVWFTPPRARAIMRRWLDGLPVTEFRAQAAGTLGTRLRRAFERCFAEGDRAVVMIGSDCPGIRGRDVRRAFHALERSDVVLGPALDGGYYLIGLRAPQPALFRAIPWSSAEVMRITHERARALKLSCRILRRLRDMDHARDARALGVLHFAEGESDC